MERFARVVLGYHGCMEETASALLTGDKSIADWRLSENNYDWIGEGVYFWEHSPERALRWATEKAAALGNKTKNSRNAAVIGAVIQLGKCFDLTDIGYTKLLPQAYEQVVEVCREKGIELPANKGRDSDLKLRKLDCFVINYLLEYVAPGFQTVRASFSEGNPAFPGAKFYEQSHIQVAVRDRGCILGVYRPNL